MRVACLLPGATEIVAALGAESAIVGISHECDYPAGILDRPRLTWSPIDSAASGGTIDRQVRARHDAGQPVIALDAAALRAARPDLLIVQDLCEVCAVVDGNVRELSAAMSPAPEVVSLRGRTIEGILEDIRLVGSKLGRESAARKLMDRIRAELAAVAVGAPATRPRVVVVEWFEPVYLAGHWVPELVRTAGGDDVGAAAGSHSARSSFAAIAALRPDLVIVALCGFGLERARIEWIRFLGDHSPEAAAARALTAPIWALDGNAYTSRPGPRTPQAAALIQHAIYGRKRPDLVRLR